MHPDKTTSLYYEFSPDKTMKTTSLYLETTGLKYKFSNSNVGFVDRNWYDGTDLHMDGGREGRRDRQRHELKTSWLLELPPKG